MKNKEFKSLIGRSCNHGSPYYLTREKIKGIKKTKRESTSNPDCPVWKIDFESGFFTYLNEYALCDVLDNRESFYWREKSNGALEEIFLLED